MDWPGTWMVFRYFRFHHFLERNGWRPPVVSPRPGSKQRHYVTCADPPSWISSLFLRSRGSAWHPLYLNHQSSFRGTAGNWLFHSLASTVRDVAGRNGQRRVSGSVPLTVRHQCSFGRFCLWIDICPCLLALAATLAADRCPFAR